LGLILGIYTSKKHMQAIKACMVLNKKTHEKQLVYTL